MVVGRFALGAPEWGARCWGASPSRVLTAELEIRQKREQIPAGTLLLAVEDPEVHVGSGGATLNALLVAAEHLSARAGFTVSCPDVPSLAQRGGGFKRSLSLVPAPRASLPCPVQGQHRARVCRLGRLTQVRAECRASLS